MMIHFMHWDPPSSFLGAPPPSPSSSLSISLTWTVRLYPCLIVILSSRKIPGLSVYAQMQNEKEQEMIQSPVSPAAVVDTTVATATTAGGKPAPHPARELVTSSLRPLDTERNTHTIGESESRFESQL